MLKRYCETKTLSETIDRSLGEKMKNNFASP